MDGVANIYENRKQKSLKMMLKTFNKLQGIEFKKFGQDLVRNKDTFSKSEIEQIAIENQVVQRPGGNINKEDISEMLDSNGMISLGSPVADKLDQRRLQEGYSFADDINISEKIQEFHTLLHDDKSSVISNFIHLMNYKNGTNIVDFQSFT